MVREVGGEGLRRRPVARKGRRVLDPDSIIDTCVEIVRNDGRSGLTIAAVARALDVSPRSIYHYFDSRRSLLAAVIGRTQQHLPMPETTGDWRTDLTRYRDEMLSYMARHRAELEITEVEGIYMMSDRYHDVVENALAIFVSIGLDPRTAYLAYGEFVRWIDGVHRLLLPTDGTRPELFEEVVEAGHRAAGSDGRHRLTAAAGTVSAAEQSDFGFALLLDSFAQLAHR